MTKNRDLKVHVRKRMEKTGESYAAARRNLQPEPPQPPPPEPPQPPPTSLAARAGGLRHSFQANFRVKAPMDGWFVLGMNRDHHEVAVDRAVGHDTSTSARIRARDASVASPTLLTQHFLAHDYHGKRLRLSAWLRCEDVTRSARLWMLLED